MPPRKKLALDVPAPTLDDSEVLSDVPTESLEPEAAAPVRKRASKKPAVPADPVIIEAEAGDTLWRIACRTLGVANTARNFYQIVDETERLKALNPALGKTIPVGTTIRTN